MRVVSLYRPSELRPSVGTIFSSPFTDDLPCRRLMVMETGCRNCHRDVHMVNSKFCKLGNSAYFRGLLHSFNTSVGVHRMEIPKPRFLFVLCSPFSIYALSLWKHPAAILKRLFFIG